MCPCNRECRMNTTAQMAGSYELQLLVEDLLVIGVNRCASRLTLIHQLACLARSRMPEARCCVLTTHALSPCSLLRRPIRARDFHAHRDGVQ